MKLNNYCKNRRIRIIEICKTLRIMSIKLEETRLHAFHLLKKLEKRSDLSGRSPRTIASAVVYLSLPARVRKNLYDNKYSQMSGVSSIAFRENVEFIEQSLGLRK